MRDTIRELGVRHQTYVSMSDIAEQLNPLLRGWIAYYGRYTPSALGPLLNYVNATLRGWLMRKFKRYMGRKTKAGRFLEQLARECPDLFEHWNLGVGGVFV
jgi:RNA-directed DNA polymerase